MAALTVVSDPTPLSEKRDAAEQIGPDVDPIEGVDPVGGRIVSQGPDVPYLGSVTAKCRIVR